MDDDDDDISKGDEKRAFSVGEAACIFSCSSSDRSPPPTYLCRIFGRVLSRTTTKNCNGRRLTRRGGPFRPCDGRRQKFERENRENSSRQGMNAVPRSLLRYLPLFTEDGATRGQGECLFSYAAFSAEGSEGDGKNKGFVGRDLEVGGIEAESGN